MSPAGFALAWVLTVSAEQGALTAPERELAAHHIVLRGAARSLAAEFAQALLLLPQGLRTPPGDPLEIELDTRLGPWGMGDGEGLPEWTTRQTRFHLYGYQEVDDPRAMVRLRALSSSARQSLWRKRALVHAILTRWNAARGFSADPRWRQLNGWLFPGERLFTWSERALNTYDGAYSRRRGRASAALDWVTFGEEVWVPGETAADDTLPCQERSRWRVFFEQLADAKLASAPTSPVCPAFEQWANPASLSHWEVLLVAASGRQPESLFGHLMLRPVRKDGPLSAGPSFAPVVQLVALTGPGDRGLRYLMRGVAGGFSTAVLTTTMGDIAARMLEDEQRTIRRFRLRLTQAESHRVLDRVWEMERRGYFDYYFFTDNCAAALLWLLNPALNPAHQVPPVGAPYVMPAMVLDALSRVQVSALSGEILPLLEDVPESMDPSRETAARALARQREDLAVLASTGQAGSIAALSAWPPDARARRGRYEAWPEQLRRLLQWERGPAVRAAAFDFVAQAARVERYALDVAASRALAVRLDAAVYAEPAVTGADLARERQQEFETEAALADRPTDLGPHGAIRFAASNWPHRPYRPAELEVLQQLEDAEGTFQRLTEIQGALVDAWFTEEDPARWLAADEAKLHAVDREQAQRSSPRSGQGRWMIEPGVAAEAGAPAAAMISLRTAALSEDAGDNRRHGYQPGSQVRLLAGELTLVPEPRLPRVAFSELTVFGFRTLQRDPQVFRTSWTDAFGWGVEANWDFRPERAFRQRSSLSGEGLWVLGAAANFESYLALELGLTAQLRWEGLPVGAWIGPRVGVWHRLHLYGAYANHLAIEAAYQPAFDGAGHWIHELDANLDLRFTLGSFKSLAWAVGPRARLWTEWDRRLEGPRTSWTLGLAVEPL